MVNEHEHKHENEDEEQYITLVDEDGNEQLHEVLFTFDSDEFEKSYVFFYPIGTLDEDEEEDVDIHVYAYIPTEDGGYGPLMQIETEEEWDMVEEVFNTFNEDQEEEE